MPAGRPSDYTPELAALICERIASGQSVVDICDQEGMPHKSTVYDWLAKRPEFTDMYAQARERQADKYFAETIAIADETQTGIKTTMRADGSVETVSADMIEHRRLRVDTRKWAAARLSPKKYGDRLAAEVSGPNGGPLQITWLPSQPDTMDGK